MTAVKNIPALIGGAAVLAAAAIGLSGAIASAEWDIEKYEDCMETTTPVDICCVSSGGILGDDGYGCRAPAALAQVTETPTAPPQFGNGILATAATNAPVSPAPGRGGTFVTPSGGVAAP